MMWGVLLVEQNEFKNAFYKFQKVLQSQPLNVDALYLSGLCCLKLEKYQECIEFCKKSSSIEPLKNENYILLTEAYLSLEDKENCLTSFEKYEKYNENDWKYYNSWGIAYQHWNDWEKSIEKFKKSIELKNDEIINHNSLSHSLIKLEKLEEAQKEIEFVLNLNPEFASCYYNLGQIYMQKQMYQEAIDVYKKALSLDVNLKKAYFNIAGAYHFRGDIKNAIKYWEKTIEYDKQNLNAYINLAMCTINDLNDSTKALRYIRSAYEINKYSPEVVFNYGLIFLKTNDVRRAQEKFEEAFNIDNSLFQARVALAECKLKLKKPSEAIEILDSIKEQKENDRDYLMVRLYCLSAIYKNNHDNIDLMDEINQICDKIQKEYGEDIKLEELQQQN